MVMLRMTANSRNAGPHSVVGLLFSFQRPSFIPRSENQLSSRALTAAGVAKTTVLRQGGRLIYHCRPVPSRESPERVLEASHDARVSTSTSTPSSRQAGFVDSPLRRSGARGRFFTPSSEPGQARCFTFPRPGGCFLASPGPSAERPGELLPSPLFHQRSRASTPPPGPRQGGNRPAHSRLTAPFRDGARLIRRPFARVKRRAARCAPAPPVLDSSRIPGGYGRA